MKRSKRFMVAAALAGALISGNALAYAPPGSPGEDAPGQERARQNCGENIEKQAEKGVAAGGGKKEGVPAPTNCDKFFSQG